MKQVTVRGRNVLTCNNANRHTRRRNEGAGKYHPASITAGFREESQMDAPTSKGHVRSNRIVTQPQREPPQWLYRGHSTWTAPEPSVQTSLWRLLGETPTGEVTGQPTKPPTAGRYSSRKGCKRQRLRCCPRVKGPKNQDNQVGRVIQDCFCEGH